MGNKITAINKTNTKVMINMDIAIEALNKTEIYNLHHIINRLTKWDEKHGPKLQAKRFANK